MCIMEHNEDALRREVKQHQRGRSAWRLARAMGIPHRVLLAFLMGQPLPEPYIVAVTEWLCHQP